MTAVLDPLKPSSAELHVIRRLNSSMFRAAEGNGLKCVRFHPEARPPSKHAALAPFRDDIPLLDPCCGQLSAAAKVNLGVKGRAFIEIPHVASALWVPPGFRERLQTSPNPSTLCAELSEDKAWNSRRIPQATLRARLSGKISFIYIYCLSQYLSDTAPMH
ncbi:hypothetical protein LDENG_00115300 [Lucifuga dentata]|nr:hypothetical protein LDENG_00115300 [Lucifuga dentata]